jgi:hypothetical protein
MTHQVVEGIMFLQKPFDETFRWTLAIETDPPGVLGVEAESFLSWAIEIDLKSRGVSSKDIVTNARPYASQRIFIPP